MLTLVDNHTGSKLGAAPFIALGPNWPYLGNEIEVLLAGEFVVPAGCHLNELHVEASAAGLVPGWVRIDTIEIEPL